MATQRSKYSGAALCRVVATLTLALAAAAVAAPPKLPPLAAPASDQQLPGKFVWADLVTGDLAASQRFYAQLFGWTFEALETGARPYSIAYLNGVPVAGLVQPESADRPANGGRWVGFMSVADVGAAVQYVTAQGGRVLVERRTLPERGDMALLADPDEIPIGVIRSSSGDRDDYLVEPGEWIWALYQSPAAEHAAAFYQDLGGYEIVPDDRFFDLPHFVLVAQGYARASLVQTPPDQERLQPGWLYFIRVTDLDQQLAAAERLGARLLVAPREDLAEGKLAVIADPAGAPVGLLEWQPIAAGDAK